MILFECNVLEIHKIVTLIPGNKYIIQYTYNDNKKQKPEYENEWRVQVLKVDGTKVQIKYLTGYVKDIGKVRTISKEDYTFSKAINAADNKDDAVSRIYNWIASFFE